MQRNNKYNYQLVNESDVDSWINPRIKAYYNNRPSTSPLPSNYQRGRSSPTRGNRYNGRGRTNNSQYYGRGDRNVSYINKNVPKTNVVTLKNPAIKEDVQINREDTILQRVNDDISKLDQLLLTLKKNHTIEEKGFQIIKRQGNIYLFRYTNIDMELKMFEKTFIAFAVDNYIDKIYMNAAKNRLFLELLVFSEPIENLFKYHFKGTTTDSEFNFSNVTREQLADFIVEIIANYPHKDYTTYTQYYNVMKKYLRDSGIKNEEIKDVMLLVSRIQLPNVMKRLPADLSNEKKVLKSLSMSCIPRVSNVSTFLDQILFKEMDIGDMEKFVSTIVQTENNE